MITQNPHPPTCTFVLTLLVDHAGSLGDLLLKHLKRDVLELLPLGPIPLLGVTEHKHLGGAEHETVVVLDLKLLRYKIRAKFILHLAKYSTARDYFRLQILFFFINLYQGHKEICNHKGHN